MSATRKLLLMQIRDDEKVRQEEYMSFLAYSGLAPSELDVLNVFDTPQFDPEILAGYQGFFIGGASEANVLKPETYPFVTNAITLIQYALAKDTPTFALGGEIQHQEKDFEIGTIAIQVTQEGRKDLLFQDVPSSFNAVAVHQQKALKAPDNCLELALTDQCCHAFKVINKRFWAFQFHPEVDKQTLVERLTIFKEKYTDDDNHLEEVLAQATETPESNGLVRVFIDRVISNAPN